MNFNNKINFQQITEKIDTLIDMAIDRSLIDSYPTSDMLNMLEEEFNGITSVLISLPDIDLRKDM